MKKASKQLLSLVLVVALLFLTVPITAIAATVTKIVLIGGTGITYCDPDGVELDPTDDYYYTVNQVETDGNIELTPSESKADFGRTVEFGIKSEEGKDVTITVNDAGVVVDRTVVDNTYVKYKLALRKSNSSEITVTPVVNYTVTMPAASTTQYELNKYGANKVESGKSFTFDLTVYSEYTDYLPLVRAGGKVLPNPESTEGASNSKVYSYTIDSVTEDLMVAVSLNAPVLVTLPTGIGYKAVSKTASTEVAYGGTFTFDVTVEPGYGVPEVRANGTVLTNPTIDGNTYTYAIENVRSTQNVTVSVAKENRKVTIVTVGDGYTTTAETMDVEYGAAYTFTVSAEDGYNAPEVTVSEGTTLKRAGSTYTINSVTENCTITITGKGKLSNTIIFNTGDGYSITDGKGTPLNSVSVEYGESYDFYVTLEEGYTASTPVVTANNIKLTPVEGKYTIIGVKENQVVSVSNVAKNTCKVTLQQGAGYTLSAVGNTTVQYGDTFEFSLTIDPAYSNSNVVVMAGTTSIPMNEATKTYSVEVKENITISVEPLTENTYTVTYPTGAGYSISAGASSVKYNGAVSFTVTPAAGYKVVAVNTTANGVKTPLTTTGNGGYTISNITAAQSIEVVTEKVTYTVRYVDSKGNGTQVIVYSVDNVKNGVITLSTPASDKKSYKFVAWQNETNAVVEELTLGNENQEITLTAQWKLVPENFFELSLKADDWKEGKTGYSIRLEASWTADQIEELKDAKVVKSGVFYSNKEITATPETLADYIAQNATQSGHTSVRIPNQPLYIYYTTYETPITELGQFAQSFTGIKEGQSRAAVAWIEVEVDGQSYIYFSGSWNGTAPTAAAPAV